MKINPMADPNLKPAGQYDQRDHTLDRALDAALARYSLVEPRAGLEQRILANLRVEQTQANRRAWWRWSLAAALAAVVLVAIALAWRPGRKPSPLTSNHSAQIPGRNTSVTPVRKLAPKVTRRHEPARQAATHIAPRKVVAANPKLDQFPSPQPLSAEEIALAQYVRNFPKEAQLVAQAQVEFEVETEREMNDAGSEARPSVSIQKER